MNTHYRNQRLCRVPEALSKTLNTRQTLCRVSHSAHSASTKPSLSSTFSRALGKDFAELPSVRKYSAKKSRCHDAGWRRRRLCRVSVGQHSTKNPPAGSPCQVLCRVLCMALGKACFLPSVRATTLGKEPIPVPRSWCFAECYVPNTRQRGFAECHTRQSD
jgi:hypothetical protein